MHAPPSHLVREFEYLDPSEQTYMPLVEAKVAILSSTYEVVPGSSTNKQMEMSVVDFCWLMG